MHGNANTFEKKHLVFLCALVASFLIYLPLLWYGPISWDDPEMVFANEAVKDFSIAHFFREFYVGNYIPVTMMMHALSYKIFGMSAGGHHAVNILLHLFNGVLVYFLSNRLFRSYPVATLSAVLFLLHPLQVESVAWIAELKNVLSACFFLSGLLMYCRFFFSNSVHEYIFTLFLSILACLSKPSAVIFPLCLMCLQLIMQHKLELKKAPPLIPFFILALVFGLINLKAQSADQFINYSHQYPIYQRAGFAGLALIKYLQLYVLPVKLSALYPYPPLTFINIVAGFIAGSAILLILFYLFRKKRFVILGIILFIVTNLILVLQFIPFGEVLYADRYAYVPVLGFSWLLALLVRSITIQANYTLLSIGLVFAFFTAYRVPVWVNGITLYEDIIKKYPFQFVALNSAGVESMRLNKDQKAEEYFSRAIKTAPRNYKGFYNSGLLYLKLNRPEKAIQRFNSALALHQYSKAYAGRASAHLMLGNADEAHNDAQKAVSLDNSNPNAFFVLGNSLSEKQQLNEAIAAYNRAVNLHPNQPEYYFRRAITFGKLNNFTASLADLEMCTSINPYYVEAYYWKGVARVNLSQNPCDDFRIAARNNYEPAITAYKKYCR